LRIRNRHSACYTVFFKNILEHAQKQRREYSRIAEFFHKVEDQPAYPHRGLLIDTARNFITVPVIKRIIDAMSYDKLNLFHWHITGK
jgi:N-acetyl-beta-hexosaminidase